MGYIEYVKNAFGRVVFFFAGLFLMVFASGIIQSYDTGIIFWIGVIIGFLGLVTFAYSIKS